MKSSVVLSILALLLISCSGGGNSLPQSETARASKEIVKVKGNRLLTLEIEGMTCVMGCGGSIRKELNNTNAVESCDFDFETGRAKNIAKISFDKNKITVDEIIKIVSHMNKGQFKVHRNSSEDISVNIKTRVEDIPQDEDASEGNLKVSAMQIESPNFLDVIANFLL